MVEKVKNVKMLGPAPLLKAVVSGMETKLRKYVPDDYLRVRDFLVANYKAFEHPVNWALVRWNYARYLCAPMLA